MRFHPVLNVSNANMISINVLSSVILSLSLARSQICILSTPTPPPLTHTHTLRVPLFSLTPNWKKKLLSEWKENIYISILSSEYCLSVSLCLNRGRLLSSATATPLRASMAEWLYSRFAEKTKKKKKKWKVVENTKFKSQWRGTAVVAELFEVHQLCLEC